MPRPNCAGPVGAVQLAAELAPRDRRRNPPFMQGVSLGPTPLGIFWARHYGQGTPEALAFALPHHRSGSSVCIKTGMAKTARETTKGSYNVESDCCLRVRLRSPRHGPAGEPRQVADGSRRARRVANACRADSRSQGAHAAAAEDEGLR